MQTQQLCYSTTTCHIYKHMSMNERHVMHGQDVYYKTHLLSLLYLRLSMILCVEYVCPTIFHAPSCIEKFQLTTQFISFNFLFLIPFFSLLKKNILLLPASLQRSCNCV